jgi:hypothetical protein
LPKELGTVIDIAPIVDNSRSLWLLLAESGLIAQWDAETGQSKRLAEISLIAEPDHDPWCNHALKPRLHAAPRGDFAATVNDYGRHGQVIDLRSGQVTMQLDGGDYFPNTVPFSFAFAQVQGRTVAIHRTDWNRLDVSDPATGELLTGRGPTSYQDSEEPPAHYLDYFHGGLRVSPNNIRIVDDGWHWHPVGIVTAWALAPWISDNFWESEDGPSRQSICARDSYWDHAVVWLDDNKIAIGGLGDEDMYMIDGVRIFDLSLPGVASPGWLEDGRWPREVSSFAGPAGTFFSDGEHLFSADQSGLSRWDLAHGCRTGFIAGFTPTHHHRAAGELVQLANGALARAQIGNRQL